MFKCYTCDAVFDEPHIIRESVPTEHGDELYMTAVCPTCGEAFGEADLCGCGDYKFENEFLCASCRRDLLAKFKDFADGLTAEEEEQLDEWLDGNSIKDRNKFC